LEASSVAKKLRASASGSASIVKLKTQAAVAAHDKDLNQLAISPNDALIASASQDKTVKVSLWESVV
jgi:U3 small nucleolar RNA-associated protein 13